MMLPASFLARPIAHRALHGPGRPENSRAAIDAAIAAGYGIEIDLQLSSDGQAMVFHDYALDRLTGESGPVRTRSAEVLRSVMLTGGEEGIPTLAQVLELVDGRVPLLIEIKDQDGAMGPDVGILEEAAAALLHDYTGDVAVMSFNPHSVAHMGRVLPDLPRGLTTCAYDPASWPMLTEPRRADLRDLARHVAETGACFVSHDREDLGNPALAALRAEGLPVLCWTIRSAEAEAQARQHADNVTFEGYAA